MINKQVSRNTIYSIHKIRMLSKAELSGYPAEWAGAKLPHKHCLSQQTRRTFMKQMEKMVSISHVPISDCHTIEKLISMQNILFLQSHWMPLFHGKTHNWYILYVFKPSYVSNHVPYSITHCYAKAFIFVFKILRLRLIGLKQTCQNFAPILGVLHHINCFAYQTNIN